MDRTSKSVFEESIEDEELKEQTEIKATLAHNNKGDEALFFRVRY